MCWWVSLKLSLTYKKNNCPLFPCVVCFRVDCVSPCLCFQMPRAWWTFMWTMIVTWMLLIYSKGSSMTFPRLHRVERAMSVARPPYRWEPPLGCTTPWMWYVAAWLNKKNCNTLFLKSFCFHSCSLRRQPLQCNSICLLSAVFLEIVWKLLKSLCQNPKIIYFVSEGKVLEKVLCGKKSHRKGSIWTFLARKESFNRLFLGNKSSNTVALRRIWKTSSKTTIRQAYKEVV